MNFYVGVDVSKFKHTVAIINNEGEVLLSSKNFANDREGFNSLLNDLGPLGLKEHVFIGMEATGHYMNCLAKFLVNHGYKVQVYNPFLIDRFRGSETNNGAKTDKLDAMLIAKYVSTHAFASSPSLSYNIEELRRFSRAKYFFKRDKTRAYNHLHRYLDEVFPEFVAFFSMNDDGKKKQQGRNLFDSPTIRYLLSNYPSAQKMASMRKETADKLKTMSKGSFSYVKFQNLRNKAKNSIGFTSPGSEQIIKSLIEQIINIDAQIQVIDDNCESILAEINSPITTIHGLGKSLSAMIMGEIGDINRFDHPDKLVKFAGLDIRIYQSGTLQRFGKLTKKGSPVLRYALTMAVQKLRIHSSIFAEYYAQKIAQKKKETVAIVSTARKLVRVIWKMLTTDQVFENLIK